MKKIIVSVGLLLLASKVGAWEVPGNPDRFLSVGLHAGTEHLVGTHSNLVDPGPGETLQSERAASNLYIAGFDVRIPFIRQATFTFSYDDLRFNGETVRTGNTYQTHDGTRGEKFDMAVRFYFTK